MPMFMDIHDVPGATAEDVAKAHLEDLNVQARHGVDYVKYWLNARQGKIFCLCTAPSAEAADAVHREAHGLRAARIVEVTPDLADAFMGAAEVDAGGACLLPDASAHDTGTRTVLFTDIVGSTSATQRLGDDAAFALLNVHDRVVRAAVQGAGGREVKHTGDGIMAVFTSAAAAVRCAMQVQKELLCHCAENPAEEVQVRIGAASGEPIERHNDFFGATVQLAARLCAHAEPTQILVSSAVAELCAGKTLPFRDIGPVTLKGFEHPVRAHAVEPQVTA